MKNSFLKTLTVGAASALFLTGCFGSSDPAESSDPAGLSDPAESSDPAFEGEWEIADSSAVEGLEVFTLDIADGKFEIEIDLVIPTLSGEEEGVNMNVTFDYEITDESDNEYTLETSNQDAEITSEILTESQADEVKEDILDEIASGDGLVTIRMEDDDDTLIVISDEGNETEFKRA